MSWTATDLTDRVSSISEHGGLAADLDSCCTQKETLCHLLCIGACPESWSMACLYTRGSLQTDRGLGSCAGANAATKSMLLCMQRTMQWRWRRTGGPAAEQARQGGSAGAASCCAAQTARPTIGGGVPSLAGLCFQAELTLAGKHSGTRSCLCDQQGRAVTNAAACFSSSRRGQLHTTRCLM